MIRVLEEYIIIFFVYSFTGWLMESVRSIFYDKRFVNRGFLVGPVCPIYGFGVLLMSILLKKYNNDVIAVFIFSMLICGILEYLTSYFMEKIFNARWWDYKNRKFNINGRICLETLIPFGICGTLITLIINPFLFKYIALIPNIILHIVIFVLCTIFVIDTIVSLNIISNIKDLKKELNDNTIEISEKVKKIILRKLKLHRRLVLAFPKIEDAVMFDKWEELKKKIDNSKKEIKTKIKNKINKK